MGEDGPPVELPTEELTDYRESVSVRDHDLYVEQDNWVTCDVDGVDRVFVADMPEETASPPRIGPPASVRIDLDGVGQSSDAVDRGKNVQVSVWLTEDMAKRLRDEIDATL